MHVTPSCYTFLHNISEGMFLNVYLRNCIFCQAFFVSHVHSEDHLPGNAKCNLQENNYLWLNRLALGTSIV